MSASIVVLLTSLTSLTPGIERSSLFSVTGIKAVPQLRQWFSLEYVPLPN